MPDINPLTNNQIFLKKIAENTGSDYETGDVSEINPLTIDQIFLKEIAANTAGQSGDITELEGKVADNTSAIEAIVNEYGAKNLLPNNAKSQTITDGTITVNSDGSIRTNISTTNGVAYDITDYFTVPAGNYIFSKGLTLGQSQIWLQFFNGSTFVRDVKLEMDASQSIIIDYDGYTQLKCVGYIPPSTTIDTTVYPMIRDARITDPTYVPYSMTNKQLTDAVTEHKVSVVGDGVKTNAQLFADLFSLVDSNKISMKSRFVYRNISGGFSFISSLVHRTAQKLVFAGIQDGNASELYLSEYILSSQNSALYDSTLIAGTITNRSSEVASVYTEYSVIY